VQKCRASRPLSLRSRSPAYSGRSPMLQAGN